VTYKYTDKTSILGVHISVSSEARAHKLIPWDISPVSDLVFDEKAMVALDLINLSLKGERTVSSFLLLFSAIEALSEDDNRDTLILCTINDLVQKIQNNLNLSNEQKNELIGCVQNCKKKLKKCL